MSEKTTSPDIIADEKLIVVDMVAELGAAAHALNEAFRNWENGHEMQAEEDALMAEQALEKLERLAMECREQVERWREGIECIHCGGSGAGHKGHCPSLRHFSANTD